MTANRTAAMANTLRELADLLVTHLELSEPGRSDDDSRWLLRRARHVRAEIARAWPLPEPVVEAAAPPRVPERIGGPLRSQPVNQRTRFIVARDLETPNLAFTTGEAFPMQDPRAIRSYGPAYGIPDAETRPMTELDYVEIRDGAAL